MAELQRRRSAKERYSSFRFRSPTRLDLEFWGWGRNDFGQLGVGHEGHQPTAVHLEEFGNKDFVQLAGNSAFNTAAVTDDGEVFMMGVNDVGQLGMKSGTLYLPTRVRTLDVYRIKYVAVGSAHVLAITEQGSLLSWGNNEHGELGYQTEGASSAVPKAAKHDKSLHFVRVAAGSGHSLALTSNGRVYSCGQGSFGALGHGNMDPLPYFSHIRSLSGFGVVQIDCGEYHSIALSIDGRVWTWGRGRYGQLGLGDTDSRSRPTPVLLLRDHHVKQVACGDAHTMCCADYGKAYAWGHSQYGQTGTGCTEDVLVPVKIEQLQEEDIVQVACGSRHSMVLAKRGAIFVFGNGELGQLGNDTALEVSAQPSPVAGLPPYPVLCILASGDHSMAMFQRIPETAQQTVLDAGRYGQGVLPFKVIDWAILLDSIKKMKEEMHGEQFDSSLSALEDIFSCPGFLLKTFASLKCPDGKARLDVALVSRSYEQIFRSYDGKMIAHLGRACISSLKLMLDFLKHKDAIGEPGNVLEERLHAWMQVLIVLMLNPVFGEVLEPGGAMVYQSASMIQYLTPFSIEAETEELENLVMELPVEVFGGRLIQGVQKHLNNITRNTHSPEAPIAGEMRDAVLKVCELLNVFYNANRKFGEPVSFDKFYNQSVSDGMELGSEYMDWGRLLQEPVETPGFKTICEVPFVLTPEAKAHITQGEAVLMKTRAVQASAIGAMFHGIHPGMVTFLDVTIRRDHIREDAMNQLGSRADDLQKPLRVQFVSNGVLEEGQDEGGLSKEFFQLLVEEIFNEDFGMFVYNDETRDFWFSHQALEKEDFRLVGITLGLAIYNNVILDVHFPLVVYKKLKGLETTLDDLKQAFPQLGKGLQQLLDFEGDVENTFLRTFEVEYEYFGEMMTAELKPGGSSIPVTNENREEYVSLYTKYTLEDSINDPFQVFREGFLQVCNGYALRLYRYEELELLICGLPHLDFKELERVAHYEGGYSAEHPTIQNFWSVVHSMSIADKKRFLSFVTGCDRAPVGGLSKLSLFIQKSEPDSNRLPTSHTCFNILLLPDYNSKDKLRDLLMLAIQNTQGFGLE